MTTERIPVHAACHCGALTVEAKIDPAEIYVCHCTDCQVFAGGPYRTIAPVRAEDFQLTGAEPSLYEKTAESGNTRTMAFCPTCGTQVYGFTPVPGAEPGGYTLRLGTAAERAELPPAVQLWCRSALDWASDLTGIEDLPRGR